MIKANPDGYFITGSDTDVGKTYVGCEIVRQLREIGFRVETRKPVESGCEADCNGDLVARDANALQLANHNRESIERIVAFRYRAALAPNRAARLQDQRLYLKNLVQSCERVDKSDCLLVEGAGGFYSPLAEDGLNADLAGALDLPVIIVVDDRVGAINQALLTIQAVEHRQMSIAAIVLNQTNPRAEPNMDNTTDLLSLCNHPVFHCDYASQLEPLFESL